VEAEGVGMSQEHVHTFDLFSALRQISAQAASRKDIQEVPADLLATIEHARVGD
jgi:hypothetical protein